MEVKSIAQAQRIAGKISTANTKMPGSSFAVDPFQCKTGSKLAVIEGTVCSKCYARRIASFRPSVKKGYENNMEKLRTADKEEWVDSMVYQIEKAHAKTGEPYHRWFDAGDLDSKKTLNAIIEVAQQTPQIEHWLPTKEAKLVHDYGLLPKNLVIRLSGTKVNGMVPKSATHTSTVHKHGIGYEGFECPAYNQNNKCDTCRACWDKEIDNISYPLH